MNPKAERNWRLACEVAGQIAAELHADADEAQARRIAEIVAHALAASYADGRADDRAILATQADAAALRRIYECAQDLRYAMRAVGTASFGQQHEATLRADFTWKRLRALLEQAALNEQHPGEALLAELAALRAALSDLVSDCETAYELNQHVRGEIIRRAWRTLQSGDAGSALLQSPERSEAAAAVLRQALQLAISAIGTDMRYVSADDERQIRAALAADAGAALLAELRAARAVVAAVRAALDAPLFEHRTPIEAALAAYDEATKGANDAP